MDIQRPIQYNPTNDRVEISVHILCIVSENIYCIIHPVSHTRASLGSQAERPLHGNMTAAVQNSKTNAASMTSPPPPLPLSPVVRPTGGERRVRVWDQVFLAASYHWRFYPVACGAQWADPTVLTSHCVH